MKEAIIYETKDLLPFADEFFDDSLNFRYALIRKPENKEEQKHMSLRGRVAPVYTVKDGFIKYMEPLREEPDSLPFPDDAPSKRRPRACKSCEFKYEADTENWEHSGLRKRALTTTLNGDTLLVRVFQYTASRKQPHRPYFIEVYRFCVKGTTLWVENRNEVKPVNIGYFTLWGPIQRSYDIYLADPEKAKQDMYKIFNFNSLLRYIDTTDDIFSAIKQHIFPSRVYKYVPVAIKEDLQAPQRRTLKEVNRYVEAEPFDDNGILFRYFVRGREEYALEMERVYIVGGKMFSFAYNEFIGQFVSHRKKTTDFKSMSVDSVIANMFDATRIDRSASTYKNKLDRLGHLMTMAGVSITGIPDLDKTYDDTDFPGASSVKTLEEWVNTPVA